MHKPRLYPFRAGRLIWTADGQYTEYQSINQAKRANRGNMNRGKKGAQ
jgi:hypothetical protein